MTDQRGPCVRRDDEGQPGSSMGRPARARPAQSPVPLVGIVAAGVAAGVVFAGLRSAAVAPLVGWDVAALIYLVWVWVWVRIWPMGPEETARLALREDPGRGVREALLLAACLASLLAVAFVLARARSVPGGGERVDVVLGVFSVVVSWVTVHTVFTARYARLYFTGVDGGIDFHQSASPRYADFAYVAFTIGVSFQVSDTNVTGRQVRRTVLGHALISYLFGAVIIAVTINLLAGLAR